MKPGSSRQEAVRFGSVIALALAARVSTLLVLRNDIAIRIPLLDSLYYMQTASGLAHGAGWPTGPHFMAPIYPFLLSGLFRLAPGTVETVQWAQLVLGICTTALVYLAARRISLDAALFGGLFYALCGPAIAYENHVLLESLLAFALAVLVWTAGTDPPVRSVRSVLTGLTIGIASTGRPTYALLLPVALIWIARVGQGRFIWRRKEVFLCALGFLLIVIPPSIRNASVTGHPSFVTTSGGLNLYIGNHAGARGIYSEPPGLFLEKDPTGTRSASQMAGRSLTPEEAAKFYTKSALRFIAKNPGSAAWLWIRKAGYFLSPQEVPQIESFDQLRSDHPWFRVTGLIVFPILFPLALLGAFHKARGEPTRIASIAVIASGAIAHLVFFSTGRYRAALLPAFSVLAGGGAVALLGWKWKRDVATLRGLWPIPAAVAIMLLAPRYDRLQGVAWTKHQTALRYEEIGADRTAESLYLESLAADSTSGDSWHNLATCQAREGRTAEAMHTYEKALTYLGENPVTLYNIAILSGEMGMDERALTFFDRAVAADPADLDIRVDRGVCAYRLGRGAAAIADWRYVASIAPDHPALGRTLRRLAAIGANLPPDLARIASAR